MRIEHAGFDVPKSKFAECVAFYRDAVGMEVVASTDERCLAFVAFPGSPNDHDIAIIGIDDAVFDERKARQMGGHLAIDMECSEDELQRVFRRFRDKGLPAQPVDHSISLSFYTTDPAGNRVELLCRKMTKDEGREHFRRTGGTYVALDGETFEPVPRVRG